MEGQEVDGAFWPVVEGELMRVNEAALRSCF
jgi:hypothetical protein